MGKKVISFSLYGKHPRYTLGAVANARHANRAYPGWVCRFYVADDVPEGYIARLKDYGAEVIYMGRRSGHEAMFWRFLATVDPENDITIVRDTDSRFTKCELLMVNEWLASGKKFHVMRWAFYNPPIMGGLWGVRGGIPDLKGPLENCQRLAVNTKMDSDQNFLKHNLYPQMKGNVFVHQEGSQVKRKCFVDETIHPFPPIAKDKRGKYLNVDFLPVGIRMPSRRIFIVFSIYKRTVFSEFFLTRWLGIMEKTNLFNQINVRFSPNIRFYVADNIDPGLIERLRRLGRVILKPAKTVYDDDYHYWKLLILSEKNLGMAVIVDFWQVLFLACAKQGNDRIGFHELLPTEHDLPTGFRNGFTSISTLSVCGPVPPISDIENLIARRDPNENYREFIHLSVYPRISTARMMGVLSTRGGVGFLEGWTRLLFPSWIYGPAVYLKTRIFARVSSLKR